MQQNSPRFLINFSKQNPIKSLLHFSDCNHGTGHLILPPSQQQQRRLISSSPPLSAWMDSIKGVFTGKKPDSTDSIESFTLMRFADELKNARRVGSFKQFIVGRSSEATFADAFEKMEGIIRLLNGFDPTGKNLQVSQKQEAAKRCNCTVAEVERALAQFTWAKEAQKKLQKLKEEGKPAPTSIAEVQKLMGTTPVDLARSNLAKSGQLSRNAFCPCGSKKRYKRCCGKDEKVKG